MYQKLIPEDEKLDFWFEFGRRIARDHAERVEDLDGAVIEEEPDVGWFSNWNFWLYPATKKYIQKKKNRAAFLPNLSVPDLAVQIDQSENEMRILIFILAQLFQGLFEHSD